MSSTYFIDPAVWPNFDRELGAIELMGDNTTSLITLAEIESKDSILQSLQREAAEVSKSQDFGNPPPPNISSIKRPGYPPPFNASLTTRPTLLELLRDPSLEKLFKDYQTLRLLMPAGNFGALQLDNENQKWMQGHVVEADGSLESNTPDWAYMSKGSPVALDSRKGMETAACFGLCAGKLYIASHLVKGCTPAAGFQCSGVTLERRYFMTVHHFDPNGPESLLELLKPNGKAILISVARLTKSPTKDLTIRRAFLKFFDRERDFALFQLDDEFDDFPNSVRTSQLIPTDQFDFNQNFAGKRVWSVGYTYGDDERYLNYWELLRHVASHEKSHMIGVMQEVTPPNFDAIFHPNQRALLLGKIVSNPISPHLWYHSIPGWFGISGSLIGYFTRGKHSELTPLIIGMFASGYAAEGFNKMVPLTSNLIRKIRAIVAAEKACGL